MKLSKVDADKIRTAIHADIKALRPDIFVMRKVLGATPWIFTTHPEYLDWKVGLSAILGVDPFGIALIGSACTGISLHPDKNYKQFDELSDIDVAVVSSYHFDLAWRYLRDIGTGKYALDRSAIAVTRPLFSSQGLC